MEKETIDLLYYAALVLGLLTVNVGVLVSTFFYGKRVGTEQVRVNNTEAIYGFASWLSTRNGVIKIGSTEPVYDIADAASRYCLVNGFDPIRDTHYPHNLKLVKEDEKNGEEKKPHISLSKQ